MVELPVMPAAQETKVGRSQFKAGLNHYCLPLKKKTRKGDI
jgi:hypothetical protein